MANLLFLILGLQIGYWAKEVYSKLVEIQAKQKENKVYGKAGVVRAQSTQMPVVDLTSPSGGVRRLRPDDYLIANMKDRDEKLKKL